MLGNYTLLSKTNESRAQVSPIKVVFLSLLWTISDYQVNFQGLLFPLFALYLLQLHHPTILLQGGQLIHRRQQALVQQEAEQVEEEAAEEEEVELEQELLLVIYLPPFILQQVTKQFYQEGVPRFQLVLFLTNFLELIPL